MDMLLAAGPRFVETLWLNIILSGDNAVVIGLVAAGLPAHQRGKAVMFGILAAAVLRIVFSVFATYLLSLWWVAFIGGAALLYITTSRGASCGSCAQAEGKRTGPARRCARRRSPPPSGRSCWPTSR